MGLALVSVYQNSLAILILVADLNASQIRTVQEINHVAIKNALILVLELVELMLNVMLLITHQDVLVCLDLLEIH